MKKLQKFLIAVLCVCALTGLMATSASADSQVLSKATITIDGPVVGNEPTKTAKLDSSSTAAGCYVKSVKWSGKLNMWDKFQGGETYTATITLGIRDNYDWKFSDRTFDATVNGTLMDEVTWYSDKELVVVAEFEKTPAPTIIDTASFTITPPEAGKTPDKNPKVPSGAPYFVNKVTWSNLSGGKFQANTSHTAKVTLHIHSDKNTWFSDKTFDAYVNGTLIDEIEWHTNNEIVVPVVFGKTGAAPTQNTTPTVIKEAKITLTGPETGKTPAKTAKVPSGANYTVKKVEWKGSLSSGKFKANTEYTAYVTLGIKSGKNATFSDKTFDAYVNDYLIDSVTWNSATEIVVPVEFEKTGASTTTTTLTIINLTLDAPTVGKKPTTTASVPSHARSAVQKVEWSGKLNSDGTFMAGEKYKVTVTMGIKAGENCKFSDKKITAKVNTKAADEVLWYAKDKVEVIYTFSKLAEPKAAVLKEARITLAGPETGKTPASTATVPSGADYTVKKVEWKGSLNGGKFKADTEYTAYVTLGVRSGTNATFSDKTFDAYVNGYLIDEITWNSATEIVVPVEFEKTGAAANPGVTVEKIPASGTAVASTQTVTVDGKKVEFQMYALLDASGNGTNYVKLRDLAYALNGTAAQFSVGYDNSSKRISVTSGQAYAATGAEMKTPFSGNRAYTGGAQSIQVNGSAVDMTAITLLDDQGGGYNYFKLRDLGAALGFNVDWSAGKGVFVETGKPYSG